MYIQSEGWSFIKISVVLFLAQTYQHLYQLLHGLQSHYRWDCMDDCCRRQKEAPHLIIKTGKSDTRITQSRTCTHIGLVMVVATYVRKLFSLDLKATNQTALYVCKIHKSWFTYTCISPPVIPWYIISQFGINVHMWTHQVEIECHTHIRTYDN